MHRDRILKVFDDLPSSLHPSDAPTFTFAHIVAPHPPFVFGADGQDVSARERPLYPERFRRLVPDRRARRSRRLHPALLGSDHLHHLEGRGRRRPHPGHVQVPPIILIQGDHGPGSHFDSGADRPNDLRERMTILNACYLPEGARRTHRRLDHAGEHVPRRPRQVPRGEARKDPGPELLLALPDALRLHRRHGSDRGDRLLRKPCEPGTRHGTPCMERIPMSYHAHGVLESIQIGIEDLSEPVQIPALTGRHRSRDVLIARNRVVA